MSLHLQIFNFKKKIINVAESLAFFMHTQKYTRKRETIKTFFMHMWFVSQLSSLFVFKILCVYAKDKKVKEEEVNISETQKKIKEKNCMIATELGRILLHKWRKWKWSELMMMRYNFRFFFFFCLTLPQSFIITRRLWTRM